MSEFSFRIKLFMLNGERDWIDKGTGFVKFVSNDETNNEFYFHLSSETDESLILYSKMPHINNIHRQMDSLLLWNENSKQYAFSFENKENCKDMILKICEMQEVDPNELDKEMCDLNTQESSADSSSIENNTNELGWADLPTCELKNIQVIVQVFNSAKLSPLRKETLATIIEEKNYIHKLVDVFRICEDLDNHADLQNLYTIIDVIFSLNKYSLYEIMFADDIILDIVGILEYNPAKCEPFKHRNHMKSSTIFKDAMPFSSNEIKEKIKKTFLVQYIQDIMLHTPSIFEENLCSLNSYLFFRKIEIINHIQDEPKIIEDLFNFIQSKKCSEDFLDKVLFLKQLIVFGQSLQPSNKESFMKLLTDNNIMNCIQRLMNIIDLKTQTVLIDILFYISEFSPSIIRSYILTTTSIDNNSIFLNIIIKLLHNNPIENFSIIILNLLKVLLDAESMIIKMEKSEFLTFFYKRCFSVLIEPLIVHTNNFDKESSTINHDLNTSVVLDHVLFLLSSFIEGHSYHIKNAILNKDIVRRIVYLLKSNHKFICLSSIHFFRKIVSMKEEFYYRFIIRENLLEPIINSYKNNAFIYNLVDSAFLDLFEYIKNEDIKCLYIPFVEKNKDFLLSIDYVSTFKVLCQRFDEESVLMSSKISSKEESISFSNASDDRQNDQWFFQDEDDGTLLHENNDGLSNKQDYNDDDCDSEIPSFLSKKRLRQIDVDNDNDSMSKKSLDYNGPLKRIIISPIRTSSTFISAVNSSTDDLLLNRIVDYPDDDENELNRKIE